MLVHGQESWTTNIDLVQVIVKLMGPPTSKLHDVGKPKPTLPKA